jgi:hypothetical protein
MSRRVRLFLIVVAACALAVLIVLPPRARYTEAPPATTVRGAFHIHSDRSDGSGSIDAIAAAAASAGLQFIIVTDHGDGTRRPEPPAYRSGVLVIDGVELNTTGGHYVVMGMPASPYPIAGTPEDVIEDVHRLGGFGVAAHPGSPRPSLRWQEWDAPIDGLEWINADSEWRDEPRLPIARALLTYLLRSPESMAMLLDRPSPVLERWDTLSSRRRVVALAALDAHARLGLRQRTDPDEEGFHVRLPPYDQSFRTFSNHVVLDAAFSNDASADARRLFEAIRAGRVYSVIDALATPGALTFTATSGSQAARAGDHLTIDGNVTLRAAAKAPPGTRLVLLRDGQRVQEVVDGAIDINAGTTPAVYRIEAYTSNGPGGPAVPWIVSNPIYAGVELEPATIAKTIAEPTSRISARAGEVAAEKGPRDTSTVAAELITDPLARTFTGDPTINWSFALSPGAATGQFAAAAIPVSPGLDTFDRVRFVVRASAPMRAWVQLRAPVGNTERWGATFYADDEPRIVDVPFAKFRAIGVTSSPLAPLNRVDTLLFVVDTLNTLPGSAGRLTISEIGFVK